MNLKITISLLFLCSFSVLLGQSNLGLPVVQNYTKSIYQAGIQNWGIQQDKSGVMYFANNEGLLVFDGSTWSCYPVANKTIVRSLLIDANKIFVGSQGDFGYFEPNAIGVLKYVSLVEKMAKSDRNFADVWSILKNKDRIYFRTARKIFEYTGDTIRAVVEKGTFFSLEQVGDTLYYHNNLTGVNQFIIGKGEKGLPNTDLLLRAEVTGIEQFSEDTLLITTLKNGVFLYHGTNLTEWKIQDNNLLKSSRINKVKAIDEKHFAFGTVSKGLFIVRKDGTVIEHIDIDNGLQSNDILDIYQDGTGNLWLALSNGIDLVETNSPFRIIEPDGNLRGTGYAVKIFNQNVYLGTANGLYTLPWKNYYNPFIKEPYQLVKGTKGQVWNLMLEEGELLLGHHEGTFRVEGKEAVLLSNLPGTWTSIALNGDKRFLLEGNYAGLNVYHFEGGHWAFRNQVQGMIEESCRVLEEDNQGNIWISQPYRGVYRLQLDVQKEKVKSIKLYGEKEGFPSNLYIHVFKVGNTVVFAAEKGIYEFDAKAERFVLSKTWGNYVSPESRVQFLMEDKKGNIWFVIDDEVGVFWVNDVGVDKRLRKQVFPQLKGKLVGGFERIYPYDDENIFFPMERGVMLFNPKKFGAKDSLFTVHLRSVVQGDTTVIFGGWDFTGRAAPKLAHYQNSLTFTFAATDFRDFSKVTFQYRLEGFDEDWSTWMTRPSKEYTNLEPGIYQFMIKARNAQGQETPIEVFEFEVLPPWYDTLLARSIYVALAILIMLGLVFIPRLKYEQEKESLKLEQQKTLEEKEVIHKKELKQSEAEILKLKQEKLESEIQYKNQELASATMHLVQKGEFLNKLREEMDMILKNTTDRAIRKDIKRILKRLNEEEQLDQDWEQFAQYFDQVHEDFLRRLREKYPQLTPKDQKLCTYLRMNLTTKEIAPLMNISIRGVEISRYRLRKKLNIETETNLVDFITNI